MVSFRHYGRCANFHYQAACAYAYAKKHGLDFAVPNITTSEVWNPLYLQNLNHFNGQEDILLTEIWDTVQHYNEYQFSEEWRHLNIVFNGYNQSYKYFDFCREEMLDYFGYHYELNKSCCGIHIRRGDYVELPYLHPVVTYEYLTKAIQYILGANTQITKFKVFSDDINYCKSFFSEWHNSGFEFSEGKTEIEDLISLSHCEHIICSNSSFSLFASEMNRNPDKIVVVPSESNWFGRDNAAKMTIKDMYRTEWIRIPYTPIYEL